MQRLIGATLVAGAFGLILASPVLAQSQTDAMATLKNDMAAHNAKCSNVTASQATLYQTCQDEAAQLAARQKALSQSGTSPTPGLSFRGGSH